MTLSELLGDEPAITPEELSFLRAASGIWEAQTRGIIREARRPRIKTRIHVKRRR